jgi:NADH dehydrogenase (ubiquinone) 1 alpha subcomplex subunit 2
MKHHNPHTPIMIREALNTQPRVFARYEFGREKVEELGGESKFPERRSIRATEDGAGRKGSVTISV